MDLKEKLSQLELRQQELQRLCGELAAEIEALRKEDGSGLSFTESPAAGMDIVELDIDLYEEPAEEPAEAPSDGPEKVAEEPPVEDYGDMPESLFGSGGESLPREEKKPSARKGRRGASAEAPSGAPAWRTDIPGPEVRSIRSAISLGDQVAFIGRLFRNDTALFQTTIDHLGQLRTLDEAVKYLGGIFPEWDQASDEVYRFMMAVRRKIRR